MTDTLVHNQQTAHRRTSRWMAGCVTLLLMFLLTGCSELNRPRVEPFYAVTAPPRKQELRWSNGRSPKSLDPAYAIAAPETDVVRALYEGLTDLDSRTLREIPGVAEKWESTGDLRTWTFHLRRDARWSNGERVTAADFVRSWKRLADIGEKTGNSYLYQNIIGVQEAGSDIDEQGAPDDFLPMPEPSSEDDVESSATGEAARSKASDRPDAANSPAAANTDAARFGAVAISDTLLKVTLRLPDKDFPKLVSHPVFRPVYRDGSFVEQRPDKAAITNGAFSLTLIDETGITLDKSQNYWNSRSVALDRVRFVKTDSAEAALDAYRNGDVDIVTNASFEPVALKLLAPYEDFKQTTHSALNFYEFNNANPPFNDRRVREALTIAIDRERLTDADLEGSTQPAKKFFPVGDKNAEALIMDVPRAASLLVNAGYPNGEGFPPIRLVVNRNNTQQRIARSVARMWKQNLNLETALIVKEQAEINDVKRSGEFDLIRRGVVLHVNDDLVNLESIFGSAEKTPEKSAVENNNVPVPTVSPQQSRSGQGGEKPDGSAVGDADSVVSKNSGQPTILTEADAIFELRAIPLYYPVSYSLIKPYIRGFEMNPLDAPSLKEVSVDSEWQPRDSRRES